MALLKLLINHSLKEVFSVISPKYLISFKLKLLGLPIVFMETIFIKSKSNFFMRVLISISHYRIANKVSDLLLIF